MLCCGLGAVIGVVTVLTAPRPRTQLLLGEIVTPVLEGVSLRCTQALWNTACFSGCECDCDNLWL